MSDLAAIRERHHPGVPRSSGNVYCKTDGQSWGEAGCDTAQVLAALVRVGRRWHDTHGVPLENCGLCTDWYAVLADASPDTGPETEEELDPNMQPGVDLNQYSPGWDR